MTPENLADLHQAAFKPVRGWSAAEFTELLAQPYVTLFARESGFALVRTVADETELLTLAVDPTARRSGIADALLCEWMTTSTARFAFLEVAEDNAAARALYTKRGFAICGRRKGYYRRPSGNSCDAVLMQATLPPRHSTNSCSDIPKTG